VILVTGFTDRMTQERADHMGVAQLAIKPVIMKDMARFIRQALGRC
jgi:hypothetical protein